MLFHFTHIIMHREIWIWTHTEVCCANLHYLQIHTVNINNVFVSVPQSHLSLWRNQRNTSQQRWRRWWIFHVRPEVRTNMTGRITSILYSFSNLSAEVLFLFFFYKDCDIYVCITTSPVKQAQLLWDTVAETTSSYTKQTSTKIQFIQSFLTLQLSIINEASIFLFFQFIPSAQTNANIQSCDHKQQTPWLWMFIFCLQESRSQT